MIKLRWNPFPEADVASYKVYRSIIGFQAPLVSLPVLDGKTLILSMNGGAPQTFLFNLTTPVVDLINQTIQGGQAYLSQDGLSFLVRSNIREAPGSVGIVGGTAIADFNLTVRTITQLSENFVIGTPAALVDPTATVEFIDNDGSLQDFYAVSTVDSLHNESKKTAFRQPIQTSGSLCVIEGVVMDLQGRRIPDAAVTAALFDTPYGAGNEGAGVTQEPITVYSGTDGRFQIAVLQSAIITLEIPTIKFSKPIKVPAKSFEFLNNLIVDDEYVYPRNQ